MSIEEFLDFERHADRKHEFVNGYAYPWGDSAVSLTGVSRRHNRIAQSIAACLHSAAVTAGCDVFGSDMLLRVGDAGYYPDVQLVCDPIDQHEQYTLRPCAIVEIASETTARTDHIEKLGVYQRIPGLRAYLIVSQTERRVTRHWRPDATTSWQLETIRRDQSVPIPCIDVDLTLDAIYARHVVEMGALVLAPLADAS